MKGIASGLLCLACVGCTNLRPAVSLRVAVAAQTPRDASVFIDEEFVGLLGHVAASGVRLPKGEHRLTVEREGYYPVDVILTSVREPIAFQVQMTPIPD
jgi:hypothetical protein